MTSISFDYIALSAFEVSSEARVFLCATKRDKQLAFAHLSMHTVDLLIITHGGHIGYLCSVNKPWVIFRRSTSTFATLETPQREVVTPGEAGREIEKTRVVQRVDAPEMSGNDHLLNGAYVSESVLNSHGWKLPGVPLYEAPTRQTLPANLAYSCTVRSTRLNQSLTYHPSL